MRAAGEVQAPSDFINDLIGSLVDVHGDGVLGLFQSGELAGEQRLAGKVAGSCMHARGDQRGGSAQVDNFDLGGKIRGAGVRGQSKNRDNFA